jgi:hypothetical protein
MRSEALRVTLSSAELIILKVERGFLVESTKSVGILAEIYCWFIRGLVPILYWLVRSDFYTADWRREFMLENKNMFGETYKCRICSEKFRNPEELRIHRIVNHKGHMLIIKR